MNQFIAAALILPLLIAFTMQYSLELKNNYEITQVQTIVEAAKETAKQDGCFTSNTVQWMKTEIARVCQLDSNQIIFNVTTIPKYRCNAFDDREMIEYEIGLPIKKLIAAGALFGIKAGDNQTIYYFRGRLASERLMPVEE